MKESYSPKWSMTTIPHSGTRYVRDSFIDAGHIPVTTRRTRNFIDGNCDLMWGHCDVGHENWMAKVYETWPDVKHFLVVRDPINTLCTHYYNTGSTHSEKRVRRCNAIRNNLDLYTRIQAHYINKYDPYIHRVEDPIASLGGWAGVELKPGSKTWSRPNDLREAADSKDAERCKHTILYSDLWEWFTTTHSRNIAPLYKDKLGYNFWWDN